MIIATLAGIAGLWCAHALAHRTILHGLRAPRLAHPQAPQDVGLWPGSVQEIRIAASGGRQLFGWLISPARPAASPAPAVLAMHDWGANASSMWPVVAPLHAAGFAVLLIDARCHGRSDDEDFTSMPRFAEDIATGLLWLRSRNDIAPDRLALLGHSVGAGAALLHAAQQRDVCAVISLSAFAPPREMMRRFLTEKHVPYPVLGWYVMRHVQRVIGARFDDFAPLTTLPRVTCPVLLVHGRNDTTVPLEDALRLHAAAPHSRLLLVDGAHDLRAPLAAYSPVIVDFLRKACDPSV
jgi:pimeloyl-ACP methyl ester carboxylesterase